MRRKPRSRSSIGFGPKQEIDPTIPADVYNDPALGPIVSAQAIHNIDVIRNAPSTIYMVNHYAPAQLVRYENWGDHLRIYLNSYVFGLINNIGLCMVAEHVLGAGPVPLRTVISAIGRKYLAERLLLLGECEIGRILFFESIMIADPPLRRVLMAKEKTPKLVEASNALNNICADFITFHELGHVGDADERYAPYAENTIAALDDMEEFDVWTGDERARILEEVFSDIFSINTVFARHAPNMTRQTLVTYTGVVVDILSTLYMLGLAADDLYQVNVDPTHRVDHLEAGAREWRHRQEAMLNYLTNFRFDYDTVIPAQRDKLPIMPDRTPTLDVLKNPNRLIEPYDEHTRRMATLVSSGFGSLKGFSAIVEACRPGYEFERWF